jgi:hypothetical protein
MKDESSGSSIYKAVGRKPGRKAKPSKPAPFIIRFLAQYYNIMFTPKAATAKTMGVGEAILFYYKMAILPLAMFLVVGAVFSATAPKTVQVGYLMNSLTFLYNIFVGASAKTFAIPFTGFAFVACVGALYLLVLGPAEMLVVSGLLHWGGRKMLKKIKGPYSRTLSAYVYGQIPGMFFIWMLMLPVFSYATATVWYDMAILAWSLIIFLDAMRNQQDLGVADLVGVAFGTAIWICIFMAVAYFATWLGTGGLMGAGVIG